MERSETMLNKKFFLVFAFFMLVAVSLNFGSAYVSLNPWNAILGGNINFSISDSSFSPFVYFYDYSGHFLETVNLGCGGVSGYCSGPQTFSVPLSSSIFPLGVYRFDIYSYSQNSWISTYFDVSSYSSYTKTCSDGTVAGTCSSTKPLDCLGSSLDSGALGFVNNCQLCGCDSGSVCQSDGSCALSSQAPAPVTSGGLSVANSVTVNVGNSVTIPISGGSGVYGLASHPNTAYAYASVSGSHVTITGVAAGATDVVITDSNSNTATISITVMPSSISTCTDSDNGSIYVQGTVTTLSGSYTDGCFPDGATLSDGYCYGPNSIGIKNVVCPAGCVNGACVQSSSSAASPSSANLNTAPSIPPVGPNEKYSALYSPKETFLVSDANWGDVLPMVSATTWTDSNGNVQKYPLLIYHEENQSITTHYQNAFSSNAQGYPSNVVYAYSIDGNNIAYITNGDIYLFNTQTLQDTLIATPPSLDDFWTSIRTVSISGDNIVWIEQDSSNKTGTDITPVPYVYKIYSYNLKNQAQTLLSSFNVDPSSGT
ncbi:MAG: hypothetical protein KGH55_00920, partial [Nanoarchaeota archaeon]|nr:hypothetical protein [Nanoarchaeota archaeon]